MKNLPIFILFLAILAGAPAFAMKCEVMRGQDHADCDYRIYTHGQKVDLYASNCQYSDDNGGPAIYPISSLSQLANGKFVLDTGAEKITLTCKK